jgi:hypothetical protein
MFLQFVFTYLAGGSQCAAGIQLYIDNSLVEILTKAEYEDEDRWGSRNNRPAFRGSYLADASGSHVFSLSSGRYSSRGRTVQFWFESGWFTNTANQWSSTQPCTKDFRYHIQLSAVSSYSEAGLSLQVKTPTTASAFTLEGERYVQACEENGCREREYSRDPFLCMAPPTPSVANTQTASPQETIAATQSASPAFTREPNMYRRSRRFSVMEYLMFSLAIF